MSIDTELNYQRMKELEKKIEDNEKLESWEQMLLIRLENWFYGQGGNNG